MIRRCFLAAGLAAVVAGPLAAQANERDMRELTRAELETAKKEIVAANMNLTEPESQAFWPLFDEYQAKRRANTDRRVALIERYANSYAAMTDVAADSLAKDWIAIEKDRAALMGEWYPKFRKILPATKAARFMQVENKLQVLIDYQLAANIPLVPAP
jgi:hypothetical protein